MSYSFQNPDGTFFDEAGTGPVTTVVPVTGATIAMTSGQNSLFVKPVGTIAALTIKMPPGPVSGQAVTIGFNQIVTALTLQDAGGNAITGAASAGAVGVSTELRFLGGSWVKWR
jgi:hypothetical protein